MSDDDRDEAQETHEWGSPHADGLLEEYGAAREQFVDTVDRFDFRTMVYARLALLEYVDRLEKGWDAAQALLDEHGGPRDGERAGWVALRATLDGGKVGKR